MHIKCILRVNHMKCFIEILKILQTKTFLKRITSFFPFDLLSLCLFFDENHFKLEIKMNYLICMFGRIVLIKCNMKIPFSSPKVFKIEFLCSTLHSFGVLSGTFSSLYIAHCNTMIQRCR